MYTISRFGVSLNIACFMLARSLTCLAQELPWPYNLPPHVKYYPEDEALLKRDMDIFDRLQRQMPVHVKKMSGDPGEKFFLDYWSFDAQETEETRKFDNTSFHMFGAPLPLHSTDDIVVPLLKRSLRYGSHNNGPFAKRDFQCPTDTQACTSINRPNTCCPNGSTCQIVQDTGLGDVGCCDASQSCQGSLSQCPQDYTSCPNNPGGGCCLPGYACYQEGCVRTSTVVVTVIPTPTTTTRSTSSETVTTVVIVTPSPPTSTDTPTLTTTTVSTTTSTTTTTQRTTSVLSSSTNALVCSTGYRSCPASLGGGCCPTNRACGRDLCPETSSSGTLNPPVRPTTDSQTSSSPPAVSSSATISICPTGFYACSAYHQGGCCQVGRDCARTSCPESAGTTVVDTNGITAVAPTGTYLSVSTTLLTGACASAWSTCAASLGGGCCPSGYACGTAACSATLSGVPSNLVGKTAPNAAATRQGSLGKLLLGIVVVVITILI